MTVTFQLEGQEFIALNGGPHFKFTEAMSLLVNCDTQKEVDELWSRLSAGGEESQCGWLKDKFCLSWQIIPSALFRLMQDPDPAKSKRVMEAMLQMRKIDIAALERAYDEKQHLPAERVGLYGVVDYPVGQRTRVGVQSWDVPTLAASERLTRYRESSFTRRYRNSWAS
jgi:hypothetical protein